MRKIERERCRVSKKRMVFKGMAHGTDLKGDRRRWRGTKERLDVEKTNFCDTYNNNENRSTLGVKMRVKGGGGGRGYPARQDRDGPEWCLHRWNGMHEKIEVDITEHLRLVEGEKNACPSAAMLILGLADCTSLIHGRREGRSKVSERFLE